MKNGNTKLSYRKSLGICFFVHVTLSLSQQGRADPVPFDRQPNFFQVVSGQLNSLDPRDGVYTKIGSKKESYNAAGYNIKDDLAYAWGRYSPYKDQLVRIHGDGSFVALGTPTTTGDPVPTFRIYAGDMDLRGICGFGEIVFIVPI